MQSSSNSSAPLEYNPAFQRCLISLIGDLPRFLLRFAPKDFLREHYQIAIEEVAIEYNSSYVRWQMPDLEQLVKGADKLESEMKRRNYELIPIVKSLYGSIYVTELAPLFKNSKQLNTF